MSDNLGKKAQEKKNVEDSSLTDLSDYAKNLESHAVARYLQKISVIGVDPARLQGDRGVRRRMSSSNRSSRSSVLPCLGSKLLYFEKVQGLQELGEL